MEREEEAKDLLKEVSNEAIGVAALGISMFDLQKAIAGYLHFFENQRIEVSQCSVEQMKDHCFYAIVLWHIYQYHEDDKDVVHLSRTVFPGLLSFQLGLYKEYGHSESGLMVVKDHIDPYINSLFSYATESVIELGYALGISSGNLFELNELTLHSMNELLWDEKAGLYNIYSLKTKRVIPHSSSRGFMPIIAGAPDINQVLLMVHRAFGDDFRQSGFYSLPSFNLNLPAIRYAIPNEGAISIVDNWLFILGLKRYDMDDLADIVLEDTLMLMEKKGFYAHFDPRKSTDCKLIGVSSSPSAAAIFLYLERTEL